MDFDISKKSFKTMGVHSLCKEDELVEYVVEGRDYALYNFLESFSRVCGEETRSQMIAYINKGARKHIDTEDGAISFADTPLRGDRYIYLWFDGEGELFYIGKGYHERVTNLYQRSDEFKRRASEAGAKHVILAKEIDDCYALDLEKILIWEAAMQGCNLLNLSYSNGRDALFYYRERDVLLWYWNGLGLIDEFSELIGREVVYDLRGKEYDEEAILGKRRWYGERYLTNDKESVRQIEEAQALEAALHEIDKRKKEAANAKRRATLAAKRAAARHIESDMV